MPTPTATPIEFDEDERSRLAAAGPTADDHRRQGREVIVKTLETTPKDATHWSTRSMAAEAGLTQNAILRIWQAFGLQPRRSETFKLSKDPCPPPLSAPPTTTSATARRACTPRLT